MTATNPKKSKATGRQNAVAFQYFSNNSSAKFTSLAASRQPVSVDRECA